MNNGLSYLIMNDFISSAMAKVMFFVSYAFILLIKTIHSMVLVIIYLSSLSSYNTDVCNLP